MYETSALDKNQKISWGKCEDMGLSSIGKTYEGCWKLMPGVLWVIQLPNSAELHISELCILFIVIKNSISFKKIFSHTTINNSLQRK